MSNDSLSAEWLARAQAAVNADPAFRQRGSIDVIVGVKVGATAFLVTFSGFSCHAVKAVVDGEVRAASVIIEMSSYQWQRFVAGRRSGNGRTLIDIDTTDSVIKAQSPRKRLEFLRYHTSLQAFFDAGVAAARLQAA